MLSSLKQQKFILNFCAIKKWNTCKFFEESPNEVRSGTLKSSFLCINLQSKFIETLIFSSSKAWTQEKQIFSHWLGLVKNCTAIFK